MKILVSTILFQLVLISQCLAQLWSPDLGDGNFKNPIVFADYSDPDLIRVNDDFYMVSSSFNCMPGIPILHSKDMVNWKIINHVYQSLPLEKYNKPAHGEGCWAPSIRYHDDKFYVYFCTPEDGLFMAVTDNPIAEWELTHVVEVGNWEDPCPLWDDDGNAYLVRSKLGGNKLILHKMTQDGKRLLDNGTIIFDDQYKAPIIEGPKFLKKEGYYYIMAPAGGVSEGWQTVLRATNIYGPYESKKVMHQGNTAINGPHQGGLVELKSGEWWFAHFQDRASYGRIVHLQAVTWQDGWPMMGIDINNDGIGEPVKEYALPNVGHRYAVRIPQTGDEFNIVDLGLQWQWQANPKEEWYSLNKNEGCLRLNAVQNLTQYGNLWHVPNLLLQKIPAPQFTATTKVNCHLELSGERCGLVVMGRHWAYVGIVKEEESLRVAMFKGEYSRHMDKTREIESIPVSSETIFLRVKVTADKMCQFEYSKDGSQYLSIGESFKATTGKWIGAKVGLFCINPNMNETLSYADFDWFRME